MANSNQKVAPLEAIDRRPGKLENLYLYLMIIVGIFPLQHETKRMTFDILSIGLFLLSNVFFVYCYIAYIFHCLPVKEEVAMNGANMYTASIVTSSCLIFVSLWLRRGKLRNFLKTLDEVKLSRIDKLLIALFHAVGLLFLCMNTSVLVPGFVESMQRCGAVTWLYHFFGVSLAWNIIVISLPIVMVMSFSYISRTKFCRINRDLNNYVNYGRPTAAFVFQKIKSIKSIRTRYNRLRQVQDEVETILHLSVLGNHMFLLISLISTLLYLVVSVVENRDQVSYSVGVSASSFGMFVVYIKASIVEMEGKEVSLPKQIILKSEKPLHTQSDEVKELTNLIRLSEIKYKIKPGGFYSLDRKFILKMIGAASTYLLVSIQFYLTEKQSVQQEQQFSGRRFHPATEMTSIQPLQ